MDDLRHKHHFLQDFPCFYALQETDNWTTSEMNVPGYIVYGHDNGRTAILCPRKVNHFRRSWVDHERCTAILVGSFMLLSVYMPHSGLDEEDYIEALEVVRTTLVEGKKAGATDFFIGGDLNIELKLGDTEEDLNGLDSIDWYGMYGPECRGGGEDVTTYEKKVRWLQLLKEFKCTVTSTWADEGNDHEHHTWRAWGSRVRKKQLDYIMGPEDLRCTTWYLNKVRLRTWDHFPVVVKIEGRELATKKGVKGWSAGHQ
jgi:endonuclease/exonuclease/phosphatase family metal-dependent hydrolase